MGVRYRVFLVPNRCTEVLNGLTIDQKTVLRWAREFGVRGFFLCRSNFRVIPALF